MRTTDKFLLVGLAVLLLGGCASVTGLPQGSVQIGDYKGSFNGHFIWGDIEVQVYEAPGGARPVIGNMQQTGQQNMLVFRGEVTGNRLEATYGFLYGSVTGELSPDGTTWSGTFKIEDGPQDQGTWKATRR